MDESHCVCSVERYELSVGGDDGGSNGNNYCLSRKESPTSMKRKSFRFHLWVALAGFVRCGDALAFKSKRIIKKSKNPR